jgi:hypothetical protein
MAATLEYLLPTILREAVAAQELLEPTALAGLERRSEEMAALASAITSREQRYSTLAAAVVPISATPVAMQGAQEEMAVAAGLVPVPSVRMV